MALSVDEVRKIAALAKLRLSPEEERSFTAQLGEIVDYIDQLQAFAGSSLPPAGAGSVEAADEVESSLERGAFLRNAPAALDSFLLVPQVKADEG